MKNESSGKRFGTVAVEKGFITIEQFAEAMKIQIIEDMGRTGGHRSVGEILVEQGIMTEEQVEEVIRAKKTLDDQ
jgi:hypothetical protein